MGDFEDVFGAGADAEAIIDRYNDEWLSDNGRSDFRERCLLVDLDGHTVFHLRDGYRLKTLCDLKEIEKAWQAVACENLFRSGYFKSRPRSHTYDPEKVSSGILVDDQSMMAAAFVAYDGDVEWYVERGTAEFNEGVKSGLATYFKEVGYKNSTNNKYSMLAIDACGDWFGLDNIPPNTIVKGDLDLRLLHAPEIPEGLVVVGSLHLSSWGMETIPNGLVVTGDLHIGGDGLASFPKRVCVGQAVVLGKSSILESGTIFSSYYELSHTEVAEPDESIVFDPIDYDVDPVENNDIRYPVVGGNLYVDVFYIQIVKDNAKIRGSIDVNNLPVDRLPNDLTIDGSLNLAASHVHLLPTGLTVNGDLDIRGTNIVYFPHDCIVGGDLIADANILRTIVRPQNVSGSILLI